MAPQTLATTVYNVNMPWDGDIVSQNPNIEATPMCRVGQNRIYSPYMTVYLVISLPKIPHIHRIYMVLANPTHVLLQS